MLIRIRDDAVTPVTPIWSGMTFTAETARSLLEEVGGPIGRTGPVPDLRVHGMDREVQMAFRGGKGSRTGLEVARRNRGDEEAEVDAGAKCERRELKVLASVAEMRGGVGWRNPVGRPDTGARDIEVVG